MSMPPFTHHGFYFYFKMNQSHWIEKSDVCKNSIVYSAPDDTAKMLEIPLTARLTHTLRQTQQNISISKEFITMVALF